jgi:nitroimidazol reductase NimA-like FMN-containing flavoprotein (pyridoxamine 5'-phosphate oxidase superfamily)
VLDNKEAEMTATRVELADWESIELLSGQTVGRLCIVDHGYPLAFPLNFRLLHQPTRVVFRTNPSSAIGRYEGPASLEVDHIDPLGPSAWSVIVRGTLRRAVEHHELPDTHPLVSTGRFHWVVLEATSMSGRRFSAQSQEDAFAVEWQQMA